MMNNLLKPRTWHGAVKSRLAAFLLAATAASGAWAATLSYSGYVSTDSANPSTVFSGVRLVDIGSTFTITGNIGGGHVANAGVATLYESSLSGNVLTAEFRILDAGSDSITYMKSVTLKLSEDSSGNVTAYASSSGFTQTTDITADIANTKTPVDSSSGQGYGIYDIALVPNVKSPVAAYDENFPSANATISTSLGNVTFYPKNGASVANGIITLSTAAGQTGPAFAFPASAYVAAIFTADFSGVTLDANQVLFATGNANKNFWTGAKLKSDGNEGFYASGLWGGTNDGSEWTTDDDSSNLLSFSGEHTFLITYDSSDGANKGTHLYVLEGNAVKHVYGKTDSNGLKSGSITKLAIGGGYGSLSGLSRIGGLEIKSCALFLSSSSLPVTPTTFATYANNVSVASDAIISISDLNASAPCVVNVTAGATVNVDAEPSSSIVWGGAFVMDGQYVISEGVTVNLKSTGKARAHYAKVTDTFAAIEDGATIYLTGEKDVSAVGTMSVVFPAETNPADLNATIIRRDGGYATATWNGTDAYTYNGTIDTSICGTSTVFDLTFTNSTDYASKSVSNLGFNADVKPVTYNNSYGDKTTGLFLKHRPYTTPNNSGFLTSANSPHMTVVVVGQLPSAQQTFFLYVGNTSYTGLMFATTDVENELLVAYTSGATVNPITTMKVPNGTSSRHVYAVTKEDVTVDDVEKSQFVVYLDGTPWKKLSINKLDISNGGIQVGADFGGGIRNVAKTINGKSMTFSTVGTSDAGVVNDIRFFGSVLDDATIAKFSAAEEYPYASPYGDSSREFAVDGNWNETATTPWTVKPAGGVESLSGSPLAGSSLKVNTDNGGTGVTVAVNLDSDTSYEALTLTGDPISFEFSEGKTGVIKATGAITIGAETTIKAGALEVGGATTILDNGVAKLIFDYSDYDASGVTVANPQTTPLVLASMDEQEEGLVTCTLPTTPHRVYSFGYANGGYNLSITAKQATLTRSGASLDVDTFAEIFASAENYAIGDTIGINEDVAIANLAVEKDITLDLGANNLTVTGEITGSGAITLTGTGTLTVPVGTTFQNITSASTKITVSGNVAGMSIDDDGVISDGDALFTIASGSYGLSVVGTVNYGDVHYTLVDGTYKAGKVFYWISTDKTANWRAVSYLDAAKWSLSENGSAGTEIPGVFDTAVFSKTDGATLSIAEDIAFNVKVEKNTSFIRTTNTDVALGSNGAASAKPETVFWIGEDATARLYRYGGQNGGIIKFYSTLRGTGTLQCEAETSSGAKPYSGVYLYGDTSDFAGYGKMTLKGRSQYHHFAASAALDNSFSRWEICKDGTVSSGNNNGYTWLYTSGTYKFGTLEASIPSQSGTAYNIVFELGENIDKGSWLGGSWPNKSSSQGGTVIWKAATATFTNEVVNSYNVTLAGGGCVYIPVNATTSTDYIPTQLNFTDNGGYLTIDDDNAAIAEGIIGAINTTTAGVGLNVGTTEALSVAAPTALQSGVSFNKKGGGEIALTGITSLGTVTVAGGTLTTPDVAYTLGATTGVTDNGDILTFYYSEAAIGTTYYSTLAGALQYVQNGETVTLLKNAASVELPQGASLATNGFTVDSITAAGGGILVLDNGVYTAYAANAAETWTGNGGDSLWSNAANWDKGYVPLATTPVTIPSSGATIYIGNWWDSRNGVRDECAYCASLTLDGNLTLAWDDYQIYSGGMYIYGPVSGTGTLTLKSVWFCNGNGSEGAPIEISTPLALVSKRFEPPAGDTSWNAYTRDTSLRDGPFVLKGATTLSGYVYLPAKVTLDAAGSMTVSGAENHIEGANSVFNGAVTVASGAALYSRGGGCTYAGTLTIDGSFYTWGATRDVFSGAITLADGARLDAWNRLGYEFNGATITCNGSNGAWLWFGNNDGENNAPYATGSGVTIYGRVNFSGDTLTGDSAKTTAVPEIRCPVKLAPYATLVLYNGSVAVNSGEGGSIAPEFPAIYEIDSTTVPNAYTCFFPEASNTPAIDVQAASPVTVTANGVTFAVAESSLKAGLYYRVKAAVGPGGDASSASTKKVQYDGSNYDKLNFTAALPADGALYYTIEASDTAE